MGKILTLIVLIASLVECYVQFDNDEAFVAWTVATLMAVACYLHYLEKKPWK